MDLRSLPEPTERVGMDRPRRVSTEDQRSRVTPAVANPRYTKSTLDFQQHLRVVRELLLEEQQAFHRFRGAVS